MEAVASTKVSKRQRRGPFVDTRPARRERADQAFQIGLGRVDPKVNVFEEHRGAVKNGGLAADEEVLHPEAIKASEEISHRERPGDS
jgi:hypothetical protein